MVDLVVQDGCEHDPARDLLTVERHLGLEHVIGPGVINRLTKSLGSIHVVGVKLGRPCGSGLAFGGTGKLEPGMGRDLPGRHHYMPGEVAQGPVPFSHPLAQ